MFRDFVCYIFVSLFLYVQKRALVKPGKNFLVNFKNSFDNRILTSKINEIKF